MGLIKQKCISRLFQAPFLSASEKKTPFDGGLHFRGVAGNDLKRGALLFSSHSLLLAG